MGLYGALVVNDAADYPGAAYLAEQLLLFSEIDHVQNAAVAAAANEAAYPSTIDYEPRVLPGERCRLRRDERRRQHIPGARGFGPAAARERRPALPRRHHPWARPRRTGRGRQPLPRPLGVTARCCSRPARPTTCWSPRPTTAPTPSTTACSTSPTTPSRAAGMLAYLKVGAGSPPPTPGTVAGNDLYTLVEDTQLDVVAPGVLGNDPGLTGPSVVSQPTHGNVSLNADGSFTYTPSPDFSGADSFVYAVADGSVTTTAVVSLTVTAAERPARGACRHLLEHLRPGPHRGGARCSRQRRRSRGRRDDGSCGRGLPGPERGWLHLLRGASHRLRVPGQGCERGPERAGDRHARGQARAWPDARGAGCRAGRHHEHGGGLSMARRRGHDLPRRPGAAGRAGTRDQLPPELHARRGTGLRRRRLRHGHVDLGSRARPGEALLRLGAALAARAAAPGTRTAARRCRRAPTG